VGINIPGKVRKHFAGYSMDDVKLRDQDEVLFFDRIYAEAKSKVFGFRMFYGHKPGLLDIVLKNRNCRKVILKRNALDSFISLRIANKSNRWLSGNPDQIQDNMVHFSMKMFLQYLDKNEKFYSHCETVINDNGQDYYGIQYEQVKDLRELNRLARFIGSQHKIAQIQEKIFKQTLPGIEHKVVNYEEMVQMLKDEGLYHRLITS
jgi:hypothetical protein